MIEIAHHIDNVAGRKYETRLVRQTDRHGGNVDLLAHINGALWVVKAHRDAKMPLPCLGCERDVLQQPDGPVAVCTLLPLVAWNFRCQQPDDDEPLTLMGVPICDRCAPTLITDDARWLDVLVKNLRNTWPHAALVKPDGLR